MVVEVIDAPWAGVPVRIRWHNTALDMPRNRLSDGDVPGTRRAGVRTPGAFGCAGDPLGDPTVALRGSHHCRIGSTTGNHVEHRVVPCQAVSAQPHLNTARFAGVQVLGVDEHVWHHQDRRRRGPRELTGIVDLTRGKEHPTARWLGLVPGRSGTVHENWLAERGEDFRSGIQIATLDPFHGTARTPSLGQLQDATSVLDAFHIVKLAGDALDEVRRRVQQDTTGHRGRKGDPLYLGLGLCC